MLLVLSVEGLLNPAVLVSVFSHDTTVLTVHAVIRKIAFVAYYSTTRGLDVSATPLVKFPDIPLRRK